MAVSSALKLPGRGLTGVAGVAALLSLATAGAQTASGAAVWAQVQATTEIRQVSVAMADGIALAADLYLPGGSTRFPTILIRGPYGRSGLAAVGEKFAASGYAVLIQDVRGTGDSGGEFYPFTYEREDGAATLEWIGRQPWSDGTVGIWGVSYIAYAGYMMLASRHPSIRAFVSSSGWAEVIPFLTRGGAFRLMEQLTWYMIYVGGFQFPPREARREVMGHIFRTTPLSSFFEGAEERAERFQSLTSTSYNVDVPILHVIGWYDYVKPNSLDAYSRIVGEGQHAAPQHLIIGPWIHNQELNGGTVVGAEDFGSQAELGLEPFLDLSIRWFDRWVKGINNGVSSEAPVRVFLMGKNEWVDCSSWPPADVTYERWYISSREGATMLNGEGLLSRTPLGEMPAGAESASDSFVYDPNNPVPTFGGANFHFFPEVVGVRDQREIELREDVLVYTSDPLRQPVEIMGPLKVVLYASSEGVDTDFTAKFVVVRPDGYARIVDDGIIRARFRDSRGEPNLMEPGEIYEFEIDLGATAITVETGSRLRLEISSSNFPKYDRNPNTGVDPFDAVEFKPVQQTVHFSPEHPSHLLLPIRGRRE